MLNCEGCIDGPAVNPGVSVFAKRNIESAERETQGRSVVSSRALLGACPRSISCGRSPPGRSCVPRPRRRRDRRDPRRGRLRHARRRHRLRRLRLHDLRRARRRDLPGRLDVGHVLPAAAALLSSTRCEQLEVTETLDQLTGLWNRRVFAERLDRRGGALRPLRHAGVAADGRHRRLRRDARRARRGAATACSPASATCSARRCASPTCRRATTRTGSRSSCPACARRARSPWPRSCATLVDGGVAAVDADGYRQGADGDRSRSVSPRPGRV